MVLEMWQYEAASMKAEKFAMGGAIHRLNRKLFIDGMGAVAEGTG